ncbi:MAG: hypothetical protein C4306_00650 [Thermoleophilia bacterium]
MPTASLPPAPGGDGRLPTPRRLRVLTLVSRPEADGGGAERLAAMIAARLDRKRFESTVCATRPVYEPHPDLAASGTRLLVLERRRKGDLAAWRPLLSLLRNERIDVLHAHMFGANVWGTTFGRLARVPVVIAHEHMWSFQGEPLRRLMDRHHIGRLATVVLAVSRDCRRKMIEIEGLDRDKVLYLPNGIPPLRPTSAGRRVRAELGISEDDPVIGSIAVLRREKAIDLLLVASEELRRRFPRLRVLVAGDGPERPSLERLARDLGLEKVVTFLGYRDDVAEVLAALDVVVSTSSFEGSPLALLEAMAAARPIVATAVGGVPDLIEHGVHGLLVSPGDSHEVSEAVASLLEQPEWGRRMGEAARERQCREFDIDVMVRRLEDLYVDLFLATSRGRDELSRAAPGSFP